VSFWAKKRLFAVIITDASKPRVVGQRPVPRPGWVIMVATAIYAGAWSVAAVTAAAST
jgi:hypothetical protein